MQVGVEILDLENRTRRGAERCRHELIGISCRLRVSRETFGNARRIDESSARGL